ncbi:MAG: error-prone DNA polymerase [Actinomycetaceae bacterium]|nr:error-prone DNA polymerase [Actinomycetaceae bacterium]
MIPYAELHAHSAFSFLHGANLPEVMVERAFELGLDAIGILDYDGMYSAVQASVAARERAIASVHGSEIRLQGGVHLPVIANNVSGYYELSDAISSFQLSKEERTETILTTEQLAKFCEGNWTVLTGTAHGPVRRALKNGGVDEAVREVKRLRDLFEHVAVESTLNTPDEEEREAHLLAEVAKRTGVPLVATTGARAADVSSVKLAHVLRAIRIGATLEEAQPYLEAFPPILRSASDMLRIHRHYPQAVENAAMKAAEVAFDLRLVAPELPRVDVPEGHDDASWLRALVEEGARERYGSREANPKAWSKIDHELSIIIRLGFAGYFLIVKEIVDFCRSENILCQGRGSAANSAVCFALGITAVDAVRHEMLFERFLSPGRSGPPDIDIDIEAARREVVIQHIYERYGRRYAAQVANVISYRPRSAMRDAAKAFGYPEEVAQLWVKDLEGARPDPRVLEVAKQMGKLPRHMGIHPGGMILTRQPVSRICPVTWAAKEGRTVLQWDKDDCAEAGLVKFDLLGLGMLTALRKMFDALRVEGKLGTDGKPFNLYNLPSEDPLVYDLLCAADTVGVFQVESRAQMNTLPRMRPRCFYDIVVEVSLVRPGPIQGQAVNPYIRRRRGREPVTYLHPLLKPALEKTLGVPIFQEQLMQIAVDAAGFDAAMADQLRKAMSSKRSDERMARLRPALFEGLAKNGISEEVASQIFESLRGFSEFGFPESHSFSFAYIVYASAWMKVHFPEEFYASILSSQPMGFYSPASLIEDARRHGVLVERADVSFSTLETRVEAFAGAQPQALIPPVTPQKGKRIRLGLSSVAGLSKKSIERIESAREVAPFTSVSDLARRAALSAKEVERLAKAGALESISDSRREAMWVAPFVGQTPEQPTLPLEWDSIPGLAPLSEVEQVVADYESTGVSVDAHPVQFVREKLERASVLPCSDLSSIDEGRRVRVAGVVTHRQRPHTAQGTVFLSLEDETGVANVVCGAKLWEKYRTVGLTQRALVVRGMVEKGDGAIALVADKLEPLWVPTATSSRDFR